MHILLIEDDPLIGHGINAGLKKMGFAIDWVQDGPSGRDVFAENVYDAVVLDLSLPGADGLDILKYWRQSGFETPVLVLTARDALDQRVTGLNLGADDYLCKPCELDELIARIRALVRRSRRRIVPQLCHGVIVFHTDARIVTRNGDEVTLSPKETQLVELFLLNKDRILTKRTIEEKIYLWGEEVSSNAVEVHIHHIRRKLGTKFIRTIHGMGYRLGEPL